MKITRFDPQSSGWVYGYLTAGIMEFDHEGVIWINPLPNRITLILIISVLGPRTERTYISAKDMKAHHIDIPPGEYGYLAAGITEVDHEGSESTP